jgi:hypothetical protein
MNEDDDYTYGDELPNGVFTLMDDAEIQINNDSINDSESESDFWDDDDNIIIPEANADNMEFNQGPPVLAEDLTTEVLDFVEQLKNSCECNNFLMLILFL